MERRPLPPAGVRIYAVGDIHGRLDLLNQLLALIKVDIDNRPGGKPIYVFLGDYIDRGDSSRGTIDRLIEHDRTSESVFLKGNHEQMALKCLVDPSRFDQWMRLGGVETLASYGLVFKKLASGSPIAKLQSEFHSALPQAHFHFFRQLKMSFTCGDFFFAHAGVKPHVALSEQKEEDLLWIRDEFLKARQDFGKIVVHGHTPTHRVEVASNRINVDTGAFATGRLSCLVIDESSISVIDTSA
ncbi:MAG: serine/threonine protein phosphatase [Rhizobiales bacterium]|nr:serine/threonine protein phosphatase [Hyphomicrobiales bacterium]